MRRMWPKTIILGLLFLVLGTNLGGCSQPQDTTKIELERGADFY